MQKRRRMKSELGWRCAGCMATSCHEPSTTGSSSCWHFVQKYQGHTKTNRTLLKELHRKGVTLTNVPFSVAMPIIGAAAKFEDEINAQMDTEVLAAAAVNTVGAATRNARNNNNGKPKVGAAAGVATCKICSKGSGSQCV